jgi:hypothetical protein
LTKQPSSPKSPTPKQPSTPLATPDRRAGTYDSDDDVTGLLKYRTDSISDIPRSRQRTTGGTAADCDLVLDGDCISAHHFVMERRASGLYVTDDASTNGLACEAGRSFGLALESLFDDKRDEGEGFLLTPGMTFLVGADPHRFIALDDKMRDHHPALIEILGYEDEIRSASAGSETPSPSDLILAADSPGQLLITGRPGCEQVDLARIIHKISKRRRQEPVEIDKVPDDRRAQNAVIKKASRGTLVLDLGKQRTRIDPAFVSSMFSPSYNIRVIVIARTPNQARRSLGHQHWRQLMHIALCPLELRRTAIARLLDQSLAARGSVLRMADLTSHNQRGLLYNPWRENLRSLHETAVRLDAMVRAGFSRRGAAAALGLKRQTFDHWFNNTMRLVKPLVPDARRRALTTALAARSPAPT